MILYSRGQHWTFQQDSGPACKSECWQEWLANNIPALIWVEDWTSGSSDLNYLDYKLWDIVEWNVCQKCHPSLELLKQSIIEEVTKIPLNMICKSIAKWSERLQLCIDNEGGHFEWMLGHSDCILILYRNKKKFVPLLVHELLRLRLDCVSMNERKIHNTVWNSSTTDTRTVLFVFCLPTLKSNSTRSYATLCHHWKCATVRERTIGTIAAFRREKRESQLD